jgi:hypothetical protein
MTGCDSMLFKTYVENEGADNRPRRNVRSLPQSPVSVWVLEACQVIVKIGTLRFFSEALWR